MVMVISLSPELEAALNDLAHQQGVTPEILILNVLRERFHVPAGSIEPRDEWERQLLGVAKDCGVSLSDLAVSSEWLYE